MDSVFVIHRFTKENCSHQFRNLVNVIFCYHPKDWMEMELEGWFMPHEIVNLLGFSRMRITCSIWNNDNSFLDINLHISSSKRELSTHLARRWWCFLIIKFLKAVQGSELFYHPLHLLITKSVADKDQEFQFIRWLWFLIELSF